MFSLVVAKEGRPDLVISQRCATRIFKFSVIRAAVFTIFGWGLRQTGSGFSTWPQNWTRRSKLTPILIARISVLISSDLQQNQVAECHLVPTRTILYSSALWSLRSPR